MKRIIFCLIAGLMSLAGPALAAELSGTQIMDQAWWSNKVDGLEQLYTLNIYNAKGDKRVRKIAMASKLYDEGHTEKRLLRFLSPPDVKGTGLLTFDYEKQDDHIWLYLPALRKTRRIVAAEKSKRFMGSEFTYTDWTPPSANQFHNKVLGQQKVGEVLCWVVENLPKSEELAEDNGFSKRIVSVGAKDFAVYKAVYYDLDGELHRVFTASKVKLVDPQKKRYRRLYMKIVNKQDGRSSELISEAVQMNSGISDKYFSKRYLERE